MTHAPDQPTIPTILPTDILRRVALLKSVSASQLKEQWQQLFDKPPPPYNRRFLESRLIYRVQELVHGGLKPETVTRLEALGERLDAGNATLRRIRADGRPAAGTQLIREWNGVRHLVNVRSADFEFEGRPFKSLSAIAQHITGTKWNGWVFFGLRSRTTS